MQELRQRNIQIIAEPQSANWWNSLLVWIVPIMMILFFLSFATRSGMARSGFSSVGKSHAKIYDQYTHSDVTFADVAGVEEAEAELIEGGRFLKNPSRNRKWG